MTVRVRGRTGAHVLAESSLDTPIYAEFSVPCDGAKRQSCDVHGDMGQLLLRVEARQAVPWPVT